MYLVTCPNRFSNPSQKNGVSFYDLVPRVSLLPALWSDGKKRDPGNEVAFESVPVVSKDSEMMSAMHKCVPVDKKYQEYYKLLVRTVKFVTFKSVFLLFTL